MAGHTRDHGVPSKAPNKTASRCLRRRDLDDNILLPKLPRPPRALLHALSPVWRGGSRGVAGFMLLLGPGLKLRVVCSVAGPGRVQREEHHVEL